MIDLEKLKEFQRRLNASPDENFIEKTPDGKANSIVISHIENLLDEFFPCLWSSENFVTTVHANEIVGHLELSVTNPITGHTIKRIGASAVPITVDAVPSEIKDNKQERNKWSLDLANKKPNALDLGYPRLKAECLKNAAASLGKIFGRDLNRKKADNYMSAYPALPDALIKKAIERIKEGEHSVIEKLQANFSISEIQLDALKSQTPIKKQLNGQDNGTKNGNTIFE